MDELDVPADAVLLISRCREGDPVAIASLVHAYTEPVYRLALSILDDPAEADEAAQDVFITVVKKIGSYRGEAAFTTWLYTVTLNICRMRLRRQKSQGRLKQVLQGLLRAQGGTAPPLEQTASENEADRALWQAIRRLDDQQREVVILRYFHELQLKEIAKIVGVTDRTVRTRLHEAHERMRGLLKGEMSLE